ncbi:beta propeller repeat protein [Spirosoma horti]
MKTLLFCGLLLAVLSCKKTESDTVEPEYKDWYTVKSPIDHEIQGVWGDYNKTLLITTGDRLFRSTDQGKSWQQVYRQSIGMFGVVEHRDTLFALTGLLNNRYLIQASNYSIDDGETWQRYTGRNPIFEPSSNSSTSAFSIDPVTASTGATYRINQVFLDGPTATTGAFETPGVITSAGRRIDLPQLHQLHSLYFDKQERLYIAGTDAVCGRGKNFAFCNSQNGRGVVYISKKPLP